MMMPDRLASSRIALVFNWGMAAVARMAPIRNSHARVYGIKNALFICSFVSMIDNPKDAMARKTITAAYRDLKNLAASSRTIGKAT